LSDNEIQRLAELELNGRQIKNIMSVSQAVAKKGGKMLGGHSIRTTIKLTQNFDETKQYLKEQRLGDI